MAGVEIDPYLLHFERELPNDLQTLLSSEKPYDRLITYTWPGLENFHYIGIKPPEIVQDQPTDISTTSSVLDISAIKQIRVARVPDPPSQAFSTTIQSEKAIFSSLYLKQQLHSTIAVANQVHSSR